MVDKKGKKLVWFLVGNPASTASSRIHGLRIHQKLSSLGYKSVLSYTPANIEEEIPFHPRDTKKLVELFHPGDMVILQKCKNEINLPFMHVLKELGVKLVLIDCDLPLSLKVAEMTEVVICSSKYLSELYIEKGVRACYIEDCPEMFFPPRELTKDENLNCYWFGEGSEERWDDVKKLKNILASDSKLKQWNLVTISNHPDADIAWTPQFLEEMKNADAIALPVFNKSEGSKVKSANRLLQAMALSVPVICSPLRSYMDVINENECGVICDSEEDWGRAFISLTEPSKRAALSRNAFIKAQEYSIDNRIDQWISILHLDKNFYATTSMEERKANQKLQQYFYRKLLVRNTNYWSIRKFSLFNGLLFLYLRARLIFQRI